MDEVVWPGAMDFMCDSEDWYTLLNWGQGLLIPNGWETKLGKVPFDGRMCTEGSYMPWFSQIKDRNGSQVRILFPYHIFYVRCF